MKRYWLLGCVAAVLVAAAGVQYAMTRGNEAPTGGVSLATSTPSIPDSGISDHSGAGYTVTPLPLPAEPSLKVPDVAGIAATIVPKNDYEKLVYKTLTDAIVALKKDTDNYDAWLTVATSFKQLERYESARDVWGYTAIVWPQEAVSHGNLGSLYHLYLKDFPKSETAYRRAIELDSHSATWYRGLYELYRYSYKQNTPLWEETLRAGITATGDLGLISVLANRYVEVERFADAVSAYDVAIAEAERQGNQKLIDAFIGERASARARLP